MTQIHDQKIGIQRASHSELELIAAPAATAIPPAQSAERPAHPRRRPSPRRRATKRRAAAARPAGEPGAAASAKPKSMAVMIVLSCLLPGLGQLSLNALRGLICLGFLFVVVPVLSPVLIAWAVQLTGVAWLPAYVGALTSLGAGLWIWQLLDTVDLTRAHNRACQGKRRHVSQISAVWLGGVFGVLLGALVWAHVAFRTSLGAEPDRYTQREAALFNLDCDNTSTVAHNKRVTRIESCLRTLVRGTPADAARAARELGDYGFDARVTAPTLVQAIRRGPQQVREPAVEALGKIADPSTLPLLRWLHDYNDLQVQAASKAATARVEATLARQRQE